MTGVPSEPTRQPTTRDSGPAMPRGWVIGLGLYHVLLAVVLFYLILELWPPAIPLPEEVRHSVSLLWGSLAIQFSVAREVQTVLLVLLTGGLGSFVHGATSFVNFVGARSIKASWRWWYVMRPFIGMGLALGFYLAVRAGFFATGAGTETFNMVGFTATAFMVGMFARQATEKLAELFDALFRVAPEGETKLKPTVDQLSQKPEE